MKKILVAIIIITLYQSALCASGTGHVLMMPPNYSLCSGTGHTQQGYLSSVALAKEDALRSTASALVAQQGGDMVRTTTKKIDSYPKLTMGRNEWVQAQYEDILVNTQPIVDIQELNERLSDATRRFEWLVAKFMDAPSVEEYQASYLEDLLRRSRELRGVIDYESPSSPWKLKISNDGPDSAVCYSFHLDEELKPGQEARSEFTFHIHKGQLIYFSPGINITHKKGLGYSPYVMPESYRIIPYPSEELASFKLFLAGDIKWNLGEQYDCLKKAEMLKAQGLEEIRRESRKKKLDVLQRKLDRLKIHLQERIVLEQISPPDGTLAIGNVLVLSYRELGFSSPLELIELLEHCCATLEDIVFGVLVQDTQNLSFFKDQILALQRPRETLVKHPDWLLRNQAIAQELGLLEESIFLAMSQAA